MNYISVMIKKRSQTVVGMILRNPISLSRSGSSNPFQVFFIPLIAPPFADALWEDIALGFYSFLLASMKYLVSPT